MPKTLCVICDSPIRDPEKNYEQRGNWCPSCDTDARKRAEGEMTGPCEHKPVYIYSAIDFSLLRTECEYCHEKL